MAINAPIIRPDPVGNFLESFRTIDTSARDQQRLEMQRQQMVEAAVQRARENKANDFNLMLKAVSRQDDLQQRAIDNEFRRQQLGISAYSANTARYNALTPNGRSSRATGTYDPLGLTGGSRTTTPAAPVIPSSMALPGDPGLPPPIEGGVDLPMSSSGPQAPLVDDTMPMDGPDATLLTPADLVPPDQMIPPPSAPTDNTPSPDALNLPPPAPPAQEPAAGPPDLTLPPLPPPSASPAPGMPDFVGPVQSIPSLAAAPIDQATNNTLLALKRQQDELKAQERVEIANATKVRTFLGQVAKDNPDAVPAYMDELVQRETNAVNLAGQKAEVEAKAKEAEAQKQVLTKRQQVLRSLGGDLDKIMPEGDRQALLAEVADPTSAAADQRLTELAVYNKIRQTRRLTHQSNGLETAAQVARAGAALETKEAMADLQGYNTYNILNEEIAKLEKKPALERTEAEQKRLDALTTKQISELPAARMWEARQATFKQAVEADIRPDQSGVPTESGTPLNALPPSPGPGPITPPATPPGINLMGDQEERRKDQAAQMMANKFWTEGKTQAAERAKLDRATDEELQALATGQTVNKFATAIRSRGPAYVDTLASSIEPAFVMPEGGNDKTITGRSGKVSVADFLQAAARDELARRRGGANGSAPVDPAKQAKIDAARKAAGLTP